MLQSCSRAAETCFDFFYIVFSKPLTRTVLPKLISKEEIYEEHSIRLEVRICNDRSTSLYSQSVMQP